ncbi:MAG: type II toxin-antitoxin system RelE/ParE family toxin [Bacteroidetes bacterium]|nr:type II toxin-antitoxin system RelE/ParE family toxin [Bacteroidota bacterium]
MDEGWPSPVSVDGSLRRVSNAALQFIGTDKPSAAANFRVKAEKSFERIKDFPDSGRLLPELPDLPYREVIVPPYRFFYRLENDFVLIVGVWHAVQLPSEPH